MDVNSESNGAGAEEPPHGPARFDAGDLHHNGDRERIYMDYNATTPLHPEVVEAMVDALKTLWKNPSSSYASNVREAIEKARSQVAGAISAVSEEILFTGSGTEANNWILECAVTYLYEHYYRGRGIEEQRPHVIISDIEHDAVAKKIWDLEARGLCDVEMVSAANQGVVDVKDVLALCRSNTCLISIMLANNESGMIQPIAELGQLLIAVNEKRVEHGEPPILLHTDAAQPIGKIAVNVRTLNVDFLTIVGHKFYGPRIGAVFCRAELVDAVMRPIFFGGGQERGLRPGTENTVDIVGLGKAAERMTNQLETWQKNFNNLGPYFCSRLKDAFGDSVKCNFAVLSNRILPNTFSVHFVEDGLEGFRILSHVKQLQASTGAACHSGKCSASLVLLNSGIEQEAAKNTIRLSMGKDTDRRDIDHTISDLEQAVLAIKQELEFELKGNKENDQNVL